MATEIITKEDLQLFRMQLLEDIKSVLAQTRSSSDDSLEGYKTLHVRKILGCSTNKLQLLRITGKLRFKKVGGTIYYKKEDVRKLINEGY